MIAEMPNRNDDIYQEEDNPMATQMINLDDNYGTLATQPIVVEDAVNKPTQQIIIDPD